MPPVERRGRAARKGLRALAAIALFAVVSLCVQPEHSLSTYAATSGAAYGTEGALTLTTSIRLALLASPDVELAALGVREAELALKEAEVGQLAGGRRALVAAERALNDARARYIATLGDVALQVEEAYYEGLRTAELLSLQQQNAEQADRRLSVAMARHEAGMIAEHEYREVELRRDEAAVQSAVAEVNHEGALLELAHLIGAESVADIRLVPIDRRLSPLAITLEEAEADARRTREEIVRALGVVEAARDNVVSSMSGLSPPVETVRAEIELDRALIKLAQAESTVRADVRQRYYALERAQTEVSLRERAAELARRRLAIAQTRYDAGMIPLLDLVTAEAASMQAELDRAVAVWQYNLERARFLRKIGRADPPPLPDPIREFVASWTE